MALIVSSVVKSVSQRFEEIIGLITVTGSYAVGGISSLDAAISLLHLTTSPNPIWVELHSTTGSGFVYQRTNVAAGSPATVGNLVILQTGTGSPAETGLAPLPAGALPAGVTSDVIAFRATYNRNMPNYVGVTSPY
jgi:hypothetical protein